MGLLNRLRIDALKGVKMYIYCSYAKDIWVHLHIQYSNGLKWKDINHRFMICSFFSLNSRISFIQTEKLWRKWDWFAPPKGCRIPNIFHLPWMNIGIVNCQTAEMRGNLIYGHRETRKSLTICEKPLKWYHRISLNCNFEIFIKFFHIKMKICIVESSNWFHPQRTGDFQHFLHFTFLSCHHTNFPLTLVRIAFMMNFSKIHYIHNMAIANMQISCKKYP